MLITTCTHCLARFRVTPQQLNAKQGQVRCGRCRKVFSGFEALERYPDDDTGSRLLAAREAQLRRTEPGLESESVPLEDVPESTPVSTPAPSPPPTPTPAPMPVPVPREGPPSKPLEERAPERPRGPVVTTYAVERDPAGPPSRAWALGAALLAVILAAEVTYATRGTLAQRYPVLRPVLDSACGAFGCSVPWPNNDALLKLEDSELLEIPGRPDQISLGARIRNLAPAAQEYPFLELTLTDLTGQAAARRVIRPGDYLGRPVGAGETIAAGAEIAIQLRLETRGLKATGYELLLFYP
jgi:predicted Zn finger-like uncharacterized protein